MTTNLLGLSRKKWRASGHYVEGTESIVRLPGGLTHRKDLFGFVDLVALPEHGPITFLQVTSWSNVSTRFRKILEKTTGKGQWEVPIRDIARRLLLAGHRIIVEGWKQKNGPGTKWIDREREVTLEDLEGLE